MREQFVNKVCKECALQNCKNELGQKDCYIEYLEQLNEKKDKIIEEAEDALKTTCREFADKFIQEYTEYFFSEDTAYSPEYLRKKIIDPILKGFIK